MDIRKLQGFLGWCAIFNAAVLLTWVISITLAHDFIYRFHGEWFNVSMDQFEAIHYMGMLYYKIGWLFFNVVPYVALRILSSTPLKSDTPNPTSTQ